MMETTFAANENVAAVHSQMKQNAIHVSAAEIFVAVRTFVVGFERMECLQMIAEHGFVDGLVVAAVGVANEPKKSKRRKINLWCILSFRKPFKRFLFFEIRFFVKPVSNSPTKLRNEYAYIFAVVLRTSR